MDQLIVVNKPEGYTSRDVVNKLSKILNTKKIGHTGTLDPIATGVLVCLTGKYTKLVDLLTALDKEYVAEIKLGIKTDTGDVTGNVIDKSNKVILKNDILDVIEKFPKKYLQTVPKYSAVKIDGKKLYEYARENIDIELPKREVNIYNLELISFNDDIIKPSKRERTKVTIDRIELTFFISLPPFYILKNCAAHKGLAKYPLIMYNKKKCPGCKRQTFSGEYRS